MCSPTTLSYFTRTKCNLYHFCVAHQRKWALWDDWLQPKTALFPIEEYQICIPLIRFFLRLNSFDKAVSCDGKWVEKSRGKKKSSNMVIVVGNTVSLSICDIICPLDISACQISGTRENKRWIRFFFFPPIDLSG